MYTVLNRHGEAQTTGASLAEAAQAVLEYDGNVYAIQPEEDGHGYRLWVSRFSRNSSCYDGLTHSGIFSLLDDRNLAEAEIFQKVINNADWWDGQTVMLDSEFEAHLKNAED